MLDAVKDPAAFARGDPPARPHESRFRLRGPADLKLNLSSTYLIKGLLERTELGLLYGRSGDGKSFIALSAALAVAADATDWLGRRVRGGSVLYVAAEGGGGFGNRISAAGKEAPEKFRWLPEAVALDNPQELAELEMVIRREWEDGADLIVIDTLARCNSRDENSAQEMGAIVKAADRLRTAFGAAVLLVHHSGKNLDNGARGSSALRAAVDTELRVERSEDGVITLRATKQRDAELGDALHFRLESVELGIDEDGDPVTSCRLVKAEAPRRDSGPRLTSNERMVLEAFDNFASDHGRPNPGGTGFPEPGAVIAVDERAFRAHAAENMAADKADARRKAVTRAIGGLVEKGVVRQNQAMLWRTDLRDGQDIPL